MKEPKFEQFIKLLGELSITSKPNTLQGNIYKQLFDAATQAAEDVDEQERLMNEQNNEWLPKD